MLGLHLTCREGIHSQQSTFHGVDSDTKRDLKRRLKKKTVPGVLWINITPLFCVYKATLAPLIVNAIIPHTSRTSDSQQVMSPETCQKRTSFQNRSKKTKSTKQSRSISSRKSRKSCQSNELLNLSKWHKAVQFKQESAETKSSRKGGRNKPRPSLNRGTP